MCQIQWSMQTNDQTMQKLRARWNGMHKRCKSVRPEVAQNYSDRGIRVCPEWDSFESFASYVINTIGVPDFDSPQRFTLDRIDNDKGYEPGNVRWASYAENLRNRRCNRVVEYMGESVTIAELADRHGMKYGLLMDRIARHGWSVEKAITTPTQHDRRRTVPYRSKVETVLELNGRSQTLSEWCREVGAELETVRSRLARGWPPEKALAAPSDKGRSSKEKAERFMHEGHPRTIRELAALSGIKVPTLRYRLQVLRMPITDALRPTFTVRAQAAEAREREL